MSATGASRANAAADSERIAAARAKAKAPASELGNFHKKRGESGDGDGHGEEGGDRGGPRPAPPPSLSNEDRAALLAATRAKNQAADAERIAAARAKAKKPARELGHPARGKSADEEEGADEEASSADAPKSKPSRPKRERCDCEPLCVCVVNVRRACACAELLTCVPVRFFNRCAHRVSQGQLHERDRRLPGERQGQRGAGRRGAGQSGPPGAH